MKQTFHQLLFTFLLICLTSCSGQGIDNDQLTNRNGIMYKINSSTPYTGKAFKKYSNGQYKSKRSYTNGRNSGTWIEYFDNGQIQSKTGFAKGNLNGLSERYKRNGQLIERVTYKNGAPDGLEERYYDNGQLQSKINYSQGAYHGRLEKFSKNGDYIEIAHYKMAKKHGEFVLNHRNGAPKERSNYVNGKQVGKYTEYWNSGKKKLSYTTKENGKYIYDYIIYNQDGTTQKHLFYKTDGRAINRGTWKRYWDENFKMVNAPRMYRSSIGFDEKGKPNTSAVFYYQKTGAKYSEGTYSSIEPDVKNGIFTWYYKNGKKRQQYNYVDNKLHGAFSNYYVEKNYANNTRVKEEGTYKNDKLHGSFTWYRGKNERDLPNNQLRISRVDRCYKMEATLVNGRLDGMVKNWIAVYPNNLFDKVLINLPLYIGHQYSDGKPIYLSNGFSIPGKPALHFKDKHHDVNNQELSRQELNRLIPQYKKTGKRYPIY